MNRSLFLFITANEFEREAFLSVLENQKPVPYEDAVNITYGYFGGYNVAHCHSQQGTKAEAEIRRAIECTGAKNVILVGIACGGVGTDEDDLGNVLISESIIDYDTHKITPIKNEPRGDITPAGSTLLRAFRNHAYNWSKINSVKTKIGQIFSSASHLNSQGDKIRIFGEFNNHPIGYEMEGASGCRACKDKGNTELIIIKGISDLGYDINADDKNQLKTERQKKASENAVSLCKYVFSNTKFGKNEETKSPEISSLPSRISTSESNVIKHEEEAYLPSTIYTSELNVIGREEDIKTIHNEFSKLNILALSGEAGIGKTITAEQYAKIHKDDYKTINHLQFSDNVQSTLMNLIDEWKMKGYESLSYDDRWNIVKNKLKTLNYKILIIIHINNENITELSDIVNLKYGQNVKFLFTTRRSVLHPCKMIEIEPLSPDEIKQLFINNACDKKSRVIIENEITNHSDDFDKIVDIYRSNTMLITLAAKVKNAANKSLSELCKLITNDPLANDEKTSVELIKDNEFPDRFPLSGHIKRLYTIAHLYDAQIDFLRNMSLMDYSGIPLEKFNEWMELDDNNTEFSLENNGFLHYELNSDGKKIIYMHPAVSDAVFEQTGANSETCEKLLNNIYNIENDEYNLHIKIYLKPTIELIIKRIGKEITLNVFHLYNFLGNLCYIAYEPKDAINYYNIALTKIKIINNTDNADLAYTLTNIGNSHSTLGEYDEAFNYYNEALKIREKVLGKDNQYTAISYNNIGILQHENGKNDEALKYYYKAVEIQNKVLGTNHQDTAVSYNNIGIVFSDRGECDEALKFYYKSIGILENVLGKDHPETASAYNNIGTVYHHKDEYDEALQYYNKALNIRENVLGKDHPITAQSYNNIGSIYNKKGEYLKSLEFHNMAIQIRTKVLGNDHPEIAESYNNIGIVNFNKDRLVDALEYYNKALKICERVYGPKHPKTIISYENIADAYKKMGFTKKARDFYSKAAAGKKAREKTEKFLL
jgi:tetratricopeptide (TPR) repeat protein